MSETPAAQAQRPGRVRRAWRTIVVLNVISTGILRARGYRFGINTVVRCSRGHLFTTIWVPLGSLKAIRLGLWRFQFCPVGRHWTLVRLIKPAALTEAERRQASAVRDIPIP